MVKSMPGPTIGSPSASMAAHKPGPRGRGSRTGKGGGCPGLHHRDVVVAHRRVLCSPESDRSLCRERVSVLVGIRKDGASNH